MATATIVRQVTGLDHTGKNRVFRLTSPSKAFIGVRMLNGNIAFVAPMETCHISSFSEIVAGCFKEESNFGEEIRKAFNCKENFTLNGIRFEFNGVTILVTKENADSEKIYAEWKTRMNNKAIKGTLKLDVQHIDLTTKMEFKNDEVAELWERLEKASRKDTFQYSIVAFAGRLAKYMQYLMKERQKRVIEVAEEAFRVSNFDNLNRMQTRYAISILEQCWKYGAELREWNEIMYGYEGDIAFVFMLN